MIRSEGAAAAAETLDTLAAALRRNVQAAVETEAGELAAEAGRRCPADSGELRESIRVAIRAQGAAVEATVGTDLKYAAAMELGTLASPPAPFLASAFRARQDVISEHIRQAVHGALEGETE